MPSGPFDRFGPPTWPSADVSNIDPVWIPRKTSTESGDRPSKRRRIEENARTFLLGDPLPIQSAALRGPFNKESWTNPWRSSGRDLESEELAADPIEEQSVKAPQPTKRETRQHVEPNKLAKPKTTRQPATRQHNDHTSKIHLPPLATPKTTWLRQSMSLRIQEDAVQDDLAESTPSKSAEPTKSISKRPTKIVKPKPRAAPKAAPKRKATRKTSKTGQAQLPLTNVSKVDCQLASKKSDLEVERLDPANVQHAVTKPLLAGKAKQTSANHEQDGSGKVEYSLARLRTDLNQGIAKDNDRKRRFMTFTTSPRVSKESPHKPQSVEQAAAEESKSPRLLTIPPMELDLDPIEASFTLDNQQIAGLSGNQHQEQCGPVANIPVEEATSGVQVSTASKMADAALQVLKTDTALQHQSVHGHISSNSGTIMNDGSTGKRHNANFQPPQIVQEESSEHIIVSSFPERQDSRAYSTTSLDMTTQAALHQAQMEFQAQFADDSPSVPSAAPLRRSAGQNGSTVTPFTVRKSQRLSANALGSTQDLLHAAQQVDFNSAKKSATAKKSKRATLVEWVPPKGLSPPAGSDENMDPSRLSRGLNVDAAEMPKHSSQQPSSQNRTLNVPLRDISSQQSNSQQQAEEHATMPVVSFMPSAAHSADLKFSGVPAASWQMGQGQQQAIEDVDKSFDLNRSLDEALEFLNVDYEF